VRRLQRGDFFGELALLYNSPRTATVAAIGEVKCVTLGRKDLQHLLGGELETVIYRNTLRIAMENDSNLDKLTPHMIELVIDNVQYLKFAQGDVIVPEGSLIGESLIIVLRGEILRKDD
jgi:CRP-like cAMP-binding protein